jgi:TRAP transporter TAXI family solute receptor
MSRSRKSLAGIVVLLTLVLLWIVPEQWGEPPPPSLLRITTGTEGGTYFTVGRRLARLLEEYSGDKIGEVQSTRSLGTLENCRRLANSEADLALAIGPVLANTKDPCAEHVSAVMALYVDHVQVVAQKEIEDLHDLAGKGKTLYIGADLSGTKVIAGQILAALEISDTAYARAAMSVTSYKDASLGLQSGRIDAAFFNSATPTQAVSDALGSGCCHLLDLRKHAERIEKGVPGLTRSEIPANTYPNQERSKVTVGANALLIARNGLADQVVAEILNSLFHHIADLAVASIHVQDVRLETAFDENSLSGLNLHEGVEAFKAREQGQLRIATGVLNGKYFNLGKTIQLLLRREGIPARVIHTDGSLENLRLLRNSERPTLAIIQYDTALASIWGAELYGVSDIDLPPQESESRQLRRIATLHDELTHILIRRDALDRFAREGCMPPSWLEDPPLAVLNCASVCLGPRESGAQVIAQAILDHHEIRPRKLMHLSVPDMVERIHSGELDAGFFVSFVPSEPLKSLVDDERIRLLSIDTRKSVGLLNAGLRLSKIGPEAGYGSQLEGEHDVDTVATRAVLVARADLPVDDVWKITRALVDGAPLLGVEGGAEAMQTNLPGLPLHPGADEYINPLPDPWTAPERLLEANWKFLASLVILVGAWQGLLRLRRDRTSNEFGNKILAVDLGARATGSVNQLLKLRDGHDGDDPSLADRVAMDWWDPRELDYDRWRDLHDLINDRIKQAQDNLMRHIAEQLRSAAQEEALDPAAHRDHLQTLKRGILDCLQRGELDASHYRLLVEMIEASQLAEPPEKVPPPPVSSK